MNKKLLAGIVAAVLILAFAVPAFAAATKPQQKEINSLLGQIAELRKQLVQKYVDSGALTKTQGDQLKKNIEDSTKYEEENGPYSAGYGCGGAGAGMMGGYSPTSGYSSNIGQSI